MNKKAVFSKVFIKKLDKIDSTLREHIKVKLKQLILDPEIGIPLKGDLKPLWKFRVSKYRIIYSFDEEFVYFKALGLRKNIYK